MLIPGILSNAYSLFIKVQGFITAIKEVVNVIESFTGKDMISLFKALKVDPKSELANVAMSILDKNSALVNAKISKALDKIPLNKAEDIGNVIDYIMKSVDKDLRSFTEKTVKSLSEEFKIDEVDSIKDNVYNLISDKVHNSLQKLGKITKANYKKFNYDAQISLYSKKMESLIHDSIKSASFVAPPGSIIVTTSPTGGPATNAQPIFLESPLK
jgi:hypothetical protein